MAGGIHPLTSSLRVFIAIEHGTGCGLLRTMKNIVLWYSYRE